MYYVVPAKAANLPVKEHVDPDRPHRDLPPIERIERIGITRRQHHILI
jgi:hypothetical protein